MRHACPERPVTLNKCPRTNKGNPIFSKTVETRKVISKLLSSMLFEKKFARPARHTGASMAGGAGELAGPDQEN